jgi:hypothetical protein
MHGRLGTGGFGETALPEAGEEGIGAEGKLLGYGCG